MWLAYHHILNVENIGVGKHGRSHRKVPDPYCSVDVAYKSRDKPTMSTARLDQERCWTRKMSSSTKPSSDIYQGRTNSDVLKALI